MCEYCGSVRLSAAESLLTSEWLSRLAGRLGWDVVVPRSPFIRSEKIGTTWAGRVLDTKEVEVHGVVERNTEKKLKGYKAVSFTFRPDTRVVVRKVRGFGGKDEARVETMSARDVRLDDLIFRKDVIHPADIHRRFPVLRS